MEEKQTQKKGERIKDGDYVKYRPLGHPITANEIHALELGLVGVLAGLAYSQGFVIESLGASALLIGLAFGVKALPDEAGEEKTIAIKTKQHEPWWFTIPYLLTFVAGMYLDNFMM